MIPTAFKIETFEFCPDFAVHVGKRFDKKAKVNFKIYDIIKWRQIITTHILPNNSRSKGSQKMKYEQLKK